MNESYCPWANGKRGGWESRDRGYILGAFWIRCDCLDSWTLTTPYDDALVVSALVKLPWLELEEVT